MYKKLSVLIVMIALLGAMHTAECKQTKESHKRSWFGKKKEVGLPSGKEPSKKPLKSGGVLSRFRKQEPVGLPGAPKPAPAKKEEPGILKRAFREVKRYPKTRRERKEGKEVGKQFREREQRESEQKKSKQEAARQQPIRTEVERMKQEESIKFEQKSTAIGTLQKQLAAERQKPRSPQTIQMIKQHEEAITERTRQRDLSQHRSQRAWEEKEGQLR